MLSTLSNLSLGAMYERFLPVAGHRAGSLLVRGYLVVAGVALVLALGLTLFGPRALFPSGLDKIVFPPFVVVLAVFALQDNTVAGLGVARWGAAKNSFHAVAKLATLVALSLSGAALAIVTSWGLTAAIAACCVMIAMRRRVRTGVRYSLPPALPSRSEMWRYFGASYGITALASIAPLVVPLVVIAQLGPDASAYLAVSWSMVTAVYVVLSLLIGPFVAECAAHPDRIDGLSAQFVKMVAAVALLGGLGLAIIGPIALGFIGVEYREHGTPLLYLAAVFIPLSVVSSVYDGLARVYRRLTLAVVTQCLVTAVVIGGSAAFTGSMGVLGIGMSYLAAEILAAAILVRPLIRWLRELRVSPLRSDLQVAVPSIPTERRERRADECSKDDQPTVAGQGLIEGTESLV
ncbi:lipopolysaccharide biosynthesis protein [Mycolicibacterium hodleri]|uniref:lipopolysaccharide biosynthesis protein n=1 Tax=Mycolicibacterium hodleri TaxID=49897 RepID=UPI001878B639|nr:lipopolysaccharide biosynthesis protein [Mycolicibacterium hodleri]